LFITRHSRGFVMIGSPRTFLSQRLPIVGVSVGHMSKVALWDSENKRDGCDKGFLWEAGSCRFAAVCDIMEHRRCRIRGYHASP
jgi:hypothetical protein